MTMPTMLRSRESSLPLLDRPGVRTAAGLLGVAAAIGIWEYAGSQGDNIFLVPFSTALSGLVALLTGPQLMNDVLPSAVRAALGFFLGSACGVLVGALVGYFRRSEPWLRPQLEFLRATPIPALLPVALLVLGATDTMRVLIIALGAVWPVLLNTADGVRSVDPRYIDAARTAGLSRSVIVRRIVLRAAMPDIFTGLRIGLGLALIMMVISEMIAAGSGLGNFVLEAQRSYAMSSMYSGILALGLLGGVFMVAFAMIERRVLAWYLGQKQISGF